MRILIVDDDAVTLELVRTILADADHELVTARDGREALDIIERGDIRLVVSDWEMPRMTGVELCAAVRRIDVAGYVYFILLTGHEEPDAVITGLNAGADDFIKKPFSPAELIVRVRAGERILALETRDLALFALAKLAESRDPETGAHLERVRAYSRLLADHLSQNDKYRDVVDGAFVRLIYLTSPLHDIGKVGIPDTVLLKPGRLSDREFEIMKNHTTMGAQTLGAALRMYPGAKFLEMARDIAASHHERWDGSGYPEKLVGENIPLVGRIVALADVYDALTSKRVYKGAFSHEVARSIIINDSGTHFDPDIVDAFAANEEAFVELQNQLADTSARDA